MVGLQVQGCSLPTEDTFFVNPAWCQVSWQTVSQMSKEGPYVPPQIPGLNPLIGPDQATRDSSFAMVAFKEMLRGEESARTYPYSGWTERTCNLAILVQGALQDMIDDESFIHIGVSGTCHAPGITEEASDIRRYLLKLINWLLNGKAYLGMLHGWVLLLSTFEPLHTKIFTPAKAERSPWIVTPAMASIDLNLAMMNVLRNTLEALTSCYRLMGQGELLQKSKSTISNIHLKHQGAHCYDGGSQLHCCVSGPHRGDAGEGAGRCRPEVVLRQSVLHG